MLELTNEDSFELKRSFREVLVDDTLTELREGKNEGFGEFALSSGRTAKYIYHYDEDDITVYEVVEAPPPPPPPPEAITKLQQFLADNPDVKELIGM